MEVLAPARGPHVPPASTATTSVGKQFARWNDNNPDRTNRTRRKTDLYKQRNANAQRSIINDRPTNNDAAYQRVQERQHSSAIFQNGTQNHGSNNTNLARPVKPKQVFIWDEEVSEAQMTDHERINDEIRKEYRRHRFEIQNESPNPSIKATERRNVNAITFSENEVIPPSAKPATKKDTISTRSKVPEKPTILENTAKD